MGVFNVGDWLYPDISQGRKPQFGQERLKQGHPLNQGLVGWWLMNEGGGLKVYDISGKGNHGTLTNGPTWSTGRSGLALSFDGTDDYVTIPNGSLNQITPYISVSAWVKVDSFQSIFPYLRGILSTYNGLDDKGFVLRFGDATAANNNNASFLITIDKVHKEVKSSVEAVAGTWYHLTGTYDGANSRIYVNGVETGSIAATGSIDTGVISPFTIGIDYTPVPTDRYFDGTIDDVRIYNRALSAREVLSLYSDPLAALDTPPIIIWAPSVGGTSNIAASGGAVAGGTAALSASYSLAAVAVAVAGGSAALSAAVPLAATGLAIASGSAGAVANVTISATALAQAAGSAGLAAGVTLGASGAGVAGGSAALSSSAAGSIAASGGAVAGGSAALSVTVTLAASGGAVAGGTATLSSSSAGTIAASGGAIAAGSALMSATVQISAAGYAQAMGAGALSVAIPLAAFGHAVAGGQATLSTGGLATVLGIGGARRQQSSRPRGFNASRSNTQRSTR